MNGFELMAGQKLKVNILSDGPRAEGQNKEEDLGEDTTNTYIHSAQDRTALMQKLSRNSVLPGDAPGAGQTQTGVGVAGAAAADSFQPSSKPSHCVLFQGMFDATQIDLRKDPSFFIDIKE